MKKLNTQPFIDICSITNKELAWGLNSNIYHKLSQDLERELWDDMRILRTNIISQNKYI